MNVNKILDINKLVRECYRSQKETCLYHDDVSSITYNGLCVDFYGNREFDIIGINYTVCTHYRIKLNILGDVSGRVITYNDSQVYINGDISRSLSCFDDSSAIVTGLINEGAMRFDNANIQIGRKFERKGRNLYV